MATFVCNIDETQQDPAREPLDRFLTPKMGDGAEAVPVYALSMLALESNRVGIRTLLLSAYEIPRIFYAADGLASIMPGSAAQRIRDLGCMLFYGDEHPHTGRRKRPPMNIDEMVKNWHTAVVGLAVAHDKDSVDRFEASIEQCLTPILTAPIKQLREFAPRLLESLRADPAVPYLVWRAYEVWVEQMNDAPDEEVIELKRGLAKDIVDMVEEDSKAQLPEAMIRALMWRSPEKLGKVRQVVAEEKAAGRKTRLKGRESCLFLEAGGTENAPAVCVQV